MEWVYLVTISVTFRYFYLLYHRFDLSISKIIETGSSNLHDWFDYIFDGCSLEIFCLFLK